VPHSAHFGITCIDGKQINKCGEGVTLLVTRQSAWRRASWLATAR